MWWRTVKCCWVEGDGVCASHQWTMSAWHVHAKRQLTKEMVTVIVGMRSVEERDWHVDGAGYMCTLGG